MRQPTKPATTPSSPRQGDRTGGAGQQAASDLAKDHAKIRDGLTASRSGHVGTYSIDAKTGEDPAVRGSDHQEW
jgi:hypothetical protein